MSEEEKSVLLNCITNNQSIISAVRDRYNKYKRDDAYFYVPISAYLLNNEIESSIKTDIGDKCYNNLNELTTAVQAWSEGKLNDIKPFINNLWNNKDNNINVLILIETDEYTFGAYVRIKPYL